MDETTRETVVGLFRTRAEAESAVAGLERAGFSLSDINTVTSRRVRNGRFGLKVITGIGIGTLIGAAAGAAVTGILPGLHPMLPGNLLVTFLFVAFTGAFAGGLAGMLLAMAAAGDRGLFYEQEVESGRVLVNVVTDRPVDARRVLVAAGAMEASPIETPVVDPMDRPTRPRVEGG
jgi:hypothetical protein